MQYPSIGFLGYFYSSLFVQIGKVGIIGKLGNDDNGNAYREAFVKEGINTTFLYTDPQEPSGVAHIMVRSHCYYTIELKKKFTK